MRAQQPLTHIRDVGLDLAFRLRPVSTTQAHREPVVVRGGQRLLVKDPLPERDFPPDMTPDDRLGAVIKQLAGHTAEVRERGTVTRPERHEILRPRQRTERITRMTEDHVKTEQRELKARERADRLVMRPSDLRLMTRGSLKTLCCPRHRTRASPLGIATHRVVATSEPIVTHQILVDSGRQKPRLRGQPLIDQWLELIELRRHPPAPVDRLSTILQIPLDRAPITAQQPADLRIAIPLPVKRPDIHQLLLADHHDLQLDDTQAASLKAASDNPRGGAQSRSPAIRLAPPGLPRQPATHLQNPVITNQHYSMDIHNRRDRQHRLP